MPWVNETRSYIVAGVAGMSVCLCLFITARLAGGVVLGFLFRLLLLIALAVAVMVYAMGVQLAPLIAHLPQSVGVDFDRWDVALALCVVVASCTYGCLSKLLTLLLGSFPVATRPLIPLAPLKAPGSARKPARLSLAVPKL